MTKALQISDIQNLQTYKNQILKNLHKTTISMVELLKKEDTLTIFEMLKFNKIATEPLSGEPENIIEVINQSHTYLVSIMAVEYLLKTHPSKTFIINWGNLPGYDIESTDGEIIAECFAATSYKSNGKLTTDLKRLNANTSAVCKYEFFYDREFTDNHKTYYKDKYPEIEIVKFKNIH